MSKIEKMIAELCPDRVKFKQLSDICKIMNGKDYKNFPKGNYPVYGTGGVIAWVDTYASDRPSVLIPRKGSIGALFYVDKPFWTVIRFIGLT